MIEHASSRRFFIMAYLSSAFQSTLSIHFDLPKQKTLSGIFNLLDSKVSTFHAHIPNYPFPKRCDPSLSPSSHVQSFRWTFLIAPLSSRSARQICMCCPQRLCPSFFSFFFSNPLIQTVLNLCAFIARSCRPKRNKKKELSNRVMEAISPFGKDNTDIAFAEDRTRWKDSQGDSWMDPDFLSLQAHVILIAVQVRKKRKKTRGPSKKRKVQRTNWLPKGCLWSSTLEQVVFLLFSTLVLAFLLSISLSLSLLLSVLDKDVARFLTFVFLVFTIPVCLPGLELAWSKEIGCPSEAGERKMLIKSTRKNMQFMSVSITFSIPCPNWNLHSFVLSKKVHIALL